MSENAQPQKRTSKHIEQENLQLTVKSGQLQYAIRQSTKDLEAINNRMGDLALEYVAVTNQEREVAQQVAAAQVAAPQSPPSVDQTATQPGSGTQESAPEGPAGQGQQKE